MWGLNAKVSHGNKPCVARLLWSSIELQTTLREVAASRMADGLFAVASLVRDAVRSCATAAAALSLLAACSSTPPTRFYALDAVAPPQSSAAMPKSGQAATTVAVRTVAVPAAVDRPQFVEVEVVRIMRRGLLRSG